MDGKPQKKDKRQVIRLSAMSLDKSPKKFLSIHECQMKDIKRGDLFFMFEDNMELVIGKEGKFLYRAKTDGMPHKDTYVVQAEEV